MSFSQMDGAIKNPKSDINWIRTLQWKRGNYNLSIVIPM